MELARLPTGIALMENPELLRLRSRLQTELTGLLQATGQTGTAAGAGTTTTGRTPPSPETAQIQARIHTDVGQFTGDPVSDAPDPCRRAKEAS